MAATIRTAKLRQVVKRLKGGSPLIAESRALGFAHNGPLRRALRGYLGRESYDALLHGPARGAALPELIDALRPSLKEIARWADSSLGTVELWRSGIYQPRAEKRAALVRAVRMHADRLNALTDAIEREGRARAKEAAAARPVRLRVEHRDEEIHVPLFHPRRRANGTRSNRRSKR
jgi:hypothetical protein